MKSLLARYTLLALACFMLSAPGPARKAAPSRPAADASLRIDWSVIQQELDRARRPVTTPALRAAETPRSSYAEREAAPMSRPYEPTQLEREGAARRARDACYATRTRCSDRCFQDSIAAMVVNKDASATSREYQCKQQCTRAMEDCEARVVE